MMLNGIAQGYNYNSLTPGRRALDMSEMYKRRSPAEPYVKNNHAVDERFCPSCRLMLKRAIYYHHGRLIKKYGRCDVFTPKRFPCAECCERLGTIERLCEHMFQVHNAPTQVKSKIFNTEAEFKVFRDGLECDGNYRMSR
ncbi:unnamed protein product, partial [Strongylus vulgaris]